MHGVLCHVWLYVCDAHYAYVYLVEEKGLGVCLVWRLIQSAYKIKTKVEAKD